jgi:hypothetical protein
MTRKQSYSSDAACLPRRSGTKAGVMECARQAKRDAAFSKISHPRWSAGRRTVYQNLPVASPSPSGRGLGAGENRLKVSSSLRAYVLDSSSRSAPKPPFPNSKSTVDLGLERPSFCPRIARKSGRSNRNQTDSDQKMNHLNTISPTIARYRRLIPASLERVSVLTFNSLTINCVDLCRNLLTSVLTFKSLVLNDVDFVDLYTRYTHFAGAGESSSSSSSFSNCGLFISNAFGHLWKAIEGPGGGLLSVSTLERFNPSTFPHLFPSRQAPRFQFYYHALCLPVLIPPS